MFYFLDDKIKCLGCRRRIQSRRDGVVFTPVGQTRRGWRAPWPGFGRGPLDSPMRTTLQNPLAIMLTWVLTVIWRIKIVQDIAGYKISDVYMPSLCFWKLLFYNARPVKRLNNIQFPEIKFKKLGIRFILKRENFVTRKIVNINISFCSFKLPFKQIGKRSVRLRNVGSDS